MSVLDFQDKSFTLLIVIAILLVVVAVALVLIMINIREIKGKIDRNGDQ